MTTYLGETCTGLQSLRTEDHLAPHQPSRGKEAFTQNPFCCLCSPGKREGKAQRKSKVETKGLRGMQCHICSDRGSSGKNESLKMKNNEKIFMWHKPFFKPRALINFIRHTAVGTTATHLSGLNPQSGIIY